MDVLSFYNRLLKKNLYCLQYLSETFLCRIHNSEITSTNAWPLRKTPATADQNFQRLPTSYFLSVPRD